MTDEITEPRSNSFKMIRDYLKEECGRREFTIGTLATAIENEKIGIYTWDRFGRFGKADEAAKEEILNLLDDIYKFDNSIEQFYDETLSPLKEEAGRLNDRSRYFGWLIKELPDFKEISEQHKAADKPRPKPQEKAAMTKIQNTHLLIIWALCTKLGIQCNERGAAVRIRELIEETGAKCDEGTISKVLKKLQEVVELKTE